MCQGTCPRGRSGGSRRYTGTGCTPIMERTSVEGSRERWRTLAAMPARRYDVPSGRVGRRFVQALAAELTGIWQRRWNAERFIVFQTATLQRAQNVTNSCEIR